MTSIPCKTLHLAVACWTRSRGDYAASSTHSTAAMQEVEGHEAGRKRWGIAWSSDPMPSVSPSRRSVAHARMRVLLAVWPDGQPVTDCAAMA
jgi:hypothetical protein